MILKIFFLLSITLSFTFSQQNKFFTISGNSQGGFNINNSAGELLLEFTEKNTDSLNLKTLGFIFLELKYFQESLKDQIDSIKKIKKINSDSGSVWKDILSYLPLLIPILALWLALLQYRLNKFKDKYKMYDQKFNVYENTDEFIKKLLSGIVEITDCIEFDKKVRIAKFIYNDKINTLLNEILAKGYKIAELNLALKPALTNSQEQNEFIRKQMKEKSDLIMESRAYRNNIDGIFKDTLKIVKEK